MVKKEIYLFDNSNAPLREKGIEVLIFDSVTGTLLARGFSDNLDPQSGPQSEEWGVELRFSERAHPLDIHILDNIHYRYPGNSVRYLCGKSGDDRIDIDLLRLPSGPAGGRPPQRFTSPASLSQWVDSTDWSFDEKRAVNNLLHNYLALFGSRAQTRSIPDDVQRVADNWGEALARVGISPQSLRAQEEVPIRNLQY